MSLWDDLDSMMPRWLFLIAIAVQLSIAGVIIYGAIHFIHKYW